MKKTMLERAISRKGSYELKTLNKGDRIPLVSDTMFHTMINNSSRKKYAAYLISLVLNMDYDDVYNNLILISENLDKSKYNESKKEVDFVCKINDEVVGIEMNNNVTKEALERNISYAADLYKSKMIKGRAYEYQKVLQININNFTFKGNKVEIERYSLKNEKGEEFTDKLVFINIYLPNIRKRCYNKEVEELTELERLMLTFNEEERLEEIVRGNRIMEEYVKESKEASVDEEIIGLYDKELHLEKLKLSAIEEAKREARKEALAKGMADGIKKGMKQGIKEGKKEGIKEGLEKGKKEGMQQGSKERSIEIAKNMLKKGFDHETISDCTGLSKEEILSIK